MNRHFLRQPTMLAVYCALLSTLASAAEPLRLEPDGILGAVLLANTDTPSVATVRRFVQVAGGNDAHIVVIVGGMSDAEQQMLIHRWEDFTAALVEIVPIRDRAATNEANTVARLERATGVWFSTSCPASIIADVRATKLLNALHRLLERRGAIGATGPVALALGDSFVPSDDPLTIAAGWKLLPGCLLSERPTPAGEQGLRRAMSHDPGSVGLLLPPQATLEISARELRLLEGPAVQALLPSGHDWKPTAVEIVARRPGDWNQLHRAARERAGGGTLAAKPPTPDVPTGSLVIIGGGRTPPEVVKKLMELAGGREARFVAMPTAMPDPLPPGSDATFLQRAGAKQVHVMPQRRRDEVDSPENLLALAQATGVWFGGGRQWRFVDAYEGTKSLEAIRGVLKRGGVIAGSSAGATIQGDYLARGSPFGSEIMMCEGYERGFAFLPGVAIDQHFSARNRFADMTGLMKKRPQFLGLGLDEGTALVVRGHKAEILGPGFVHFYDRNKPLVGGEPDYQKGKAGDTFDFQERELIKGEKKAEQDAKEVK